MIYLLIGAIVFVLADILIRVLFKSYQKKQARQIRHDLLEQSLHVDLSREAKSLKQVKVKNPKARILCVDDEEIVLDSFRKILVLDGYSIDTVESGAEALGLIHSHHYDFVFTDLKMPEMDGTEVARAVKEIRPDMDVVIITGYATVESAVACMQHGAMDYVQKPFSEDELLLFVEKLRLARRERIKNDLKPRVQITRLPPESALDFDEFAIPGGVFISSGHCWASIDADGLIKLGIDDFAKNTIGGIDDIEFPNLRMNARKGFPLFSVKHEGASIQFNSPLSGTVSKINQDLLTRLDEMDLTTYGNNWICVLDADNLDSEISDLKIGKAVVAFYQEEIQTLTSIIGKSDQGGDGDPVPLGKRRLSQVQFEGMDEETRHSVIARFFQR